MAGRAAVLSEEGLEAGHPCVPTGHSGNYTYGGKLMQMKAHKVSGCQDGWVVRGWAWQWRKLAGEWLHRWEVAQLHAQALQLAAGLGRETGVMALCCSCLSCPAVASAPPLLLLPACRTAPPKMPVRRWCWLR